MAEKVEVVIKIPEYYLTHPQYYSCLAECVRRGVVLPKGHGDLVDKKDLSLMTVHLVDSVLVCDAPTIVGAYKAEMEGEEE